MGRNGGSSKDFGCSQDLRGLGGAEQGHEEKKFSFANGGGDFSIARGSKVLSKTDANSGFWQIDSEEESGELKTIITPFGRFQFRKIPFGMSAAPGFFQRQMVRILEELEGLAYKIDDVLVFGNDEKGHDDRLKLVMGRLDKSGMTLSKETWQF